MKVSDLFNDWILENIGKADTIEKSVMVDNLLNLGEFVYELGKRDGIRKVQEEEEVWIDLHKQAVIRMSRIGKEGKSNK